VTSLTDRIVEIAMRPADQVPELPLEFATLSLFDWMTCGIAGIGEPLATKLRRLAQDEGGQPAASVLGGMRAPPRMAALVNGATSHALDFDDTHFAHVGHLSVGIYPAALAVAELQDASANEMVTAFLLGAEGAIRVGMTLGRAHYNHGFHQTATAGAFGATLAAGRLLGLYEGQMRHALGLCATRASGLTSQFGSMGKPYNAGIAASNGVECAMLANLGFTAADDGLTGRQGFVGTHRPGESGTVEPDMAFDSYLFPDNKYKLHACCHGLHPMIEALLAADRPAGLTLDDISAFSLSTNPRWLAVCDIKRPRTGLEVKFSYSWLAGMTLRGDDTGDDRLFTDSIAGDAALAAFAARVSVTGDADLTDLQARGEISLEDGRNIPVWFDLADPFSPAVLAAKLQQKSSTIIGDAATAIWDLHPRLDQLGARDVAAVLVTAGGDAKAASG